MNGAESRIALVTGGSRGIGRAISVALADAGMAIAVNYQNRVKDAETVVQEISRHHGRAEAFRCDVSVGSLIQEMVRAVQERLGRIDVLVNNAGIAASPDDATSEEEFDRTLAINLKSAFLCTEAVLPGMRQRRWGRVINVSAMGARAGSRSVAYGTAKAGLEGLTRSYALQLAKVGITVNAVAPGLIETEMTQSLIESGSVLERIPTGRAGTAQEIAQAVLSLVKNGYITGQTLSVNGGLFFS